jgi:2-iminobutanoate/2-iminopropanoate deaminase
MNRAIPRGIVAVLGFISCAACQSGTRETGTGDQAGHKAPDVQYFPMRPVPGRPAFPFSSAVRVGDMIFLSGQIGIDSTGKLVPGGIEPETRQTFANIRAALENASSSLDHVVKCTAMLADMREWPAMNAVYATYFPPDKLPARSALGANGLALGARVEIECWATVKPR